MTYRPKLTPEQIAATLERHKIEEGAEILGMHYDDDGTWIVVNTTGGPLRLVVPDDVLAQRPAESDTTRSVFDHGGE